MHVFVFNLLVLSSVAAVVWTLRDRRRVEYAQLEHLRSYVRIVLGVTMISYEGRAAIVVPPRETRHPLAHRVPVQPMTT